jgi:hypothetical protein
MRKPDLIIGPRHDPQTVRWHIFVWRGWQLSLHKWLRSDSDRAPHDHKADNLSIILNAGYWETIRTREWWEYPERIGGGPYDPKAFELAGWKHYGDGEFYRDVDRTYFRWPLVPYFRKAETPHRVTLPSDGKPVYTLWLRWPARRRWGYWCPKGWVDADDYNSTADYYAAGISEVGNGCG